MCCKEPPDLDTSSGTRTKRTSSNDSRQSSVSDMRTVIGLLYMRNRKDVSQTRKDHLEVIDEIEINVTVSDR